MYVLLNTLLVAKYILIVILAVGVTLMLALMADLTFVMIRAWRTEDKRIKAEERAVKSKKAVDILLERAKADLRAKKEAEAWEPFFENKYTTGFNDMGIPFHRHHRVRTTEANDYFRMMDELTEEHPDVIADGSIFEQTEEI